MPCILYLGLCQNCRLERAIEMTCAWNGLSLRTDHASRRFGDLLTVMIGASAAKAAGERPALGTSRAHHNQIPANSDDGGHATESDLRVPAVT